MTLQDPANKILLEGHKGRHGSGYHEYVLARIRDAIDGPTARRMPPGRCAPCLRS
jgi:hypothetical protein